MSDSDKTEAGYIPTGEALDLSGLVDYSPGSVVSRQLANSDAGTMTLFAFDTGQGLSEHSTPFDAVVQILDGEAELFIGGSTVRAKTGQLVIMPADVPHAVKAHQRFKMFLTMLRAN